MFDPTKYRHDFPILDRKVYGRELVYLDNTATSQTPRCVVEAIEHQYYTQKANVHRGVHCLSLEATDAMEASRKRVAEYINAESHRQVIFTRGTTEALNLVASSYGALLSPGDEIVLTVMEHHSNIVPWQMLAERAGLVLKVAPTRADGSLDIEAWEGLFGERTRVAAFCHVSNVLGTVNPVTRMTAFAHAHGAIAVVDGAQASPHMPIDVQALGADFYAFSAHKMYGPTGVGVLYGRSELLEQMPPYQGGGEMIGHVSFSGTTWAELPYKFEAGTPDFVGCAALHRALDYIESIGLDAIAAHEHDLLRYTTECMEALGGITIYGTTADKEPVISFLIDGAHHYDTGVLLDRLGIAVRTGHHCAQPLMESLEIEGTVRASFALYNTREEADRFIEALKRVKQMLQ